MLQKIYDNSPIFFQNLMVSFKGKQFIKERYNNEYRKEINYLRGLENEFDIQELRLSEFINYVRENSEYYKKVLRDTPKSFKLEDLKKLPVMDKEGIRQNIDTLVTRKDSLIEMGTGGSTGKS